ncbi:monovalent cation/H(+) antiporter subunit G [Oryzibacter oryziterrae]|uniref:monovalent cation/H(+) antiporter subunit G n=1 Tax=Oryzibacter oryziterrae TaxID=2766474 RepID=UPI001F00A52E|nr:monovalent cation/H(+) antiporter subunit G [Oryzibacter oryziterrae]
MQLLLAIATASLLLVGSIFALTGALGLIRFPDVYTRMHAASKAGTLGSGFCLAALAVHAPTLDVMPRALVAIAFFMLTAPISAHLLARAALLAGYMPLGANDAISKQSVNQDDVP